MSASALALTSTLTLVLVDALAAPLMLLAGVGMLVFAAGMLVMAAGMRVLAAGMLVFAACMGIRRGACMLGLASGIVMPGSGIRRGACMLGLASGIVMMLVAGVLMLAVCFARLYPGGGPRGCCGLSCPDFGLAAACASLSEISSGCHGPRSCQQFLICYCARNRLVIWKYYKAF